MTFKYHSTCITLQKAGNVSPPPDAPSLHLGGSPFSAVCVSVRPSCPLSRRRRKNLTLFSTVNLFNDVSWLKWLVWSCLGKYQGLGRRPMMLWFMVSLLHPRGKIPVWVSNCKHLCVSYLILTSLKHENTWRPEAYMAPHSWITYSCSFTSLWGLLGTFISKGNLINTASNSLKCHILGTPLAF